MSRSTLPVFAIDVDEVLANTLDQLNKWYNTVYGTCFVLEDYKSYYFCQTWGCTDREAMDRFLQFTESDMWDAIEPVPGAQDFVNAMYPHFRLAIVTSRQNCLKISTEKWLDRHFGLDKFDFIRFGNQWLADKDAVRITKYHMCKEIQAIALVDDLPSYILQVAPIVEMAILFNHNHEYNWSKLSAGTMSVHQNIRVCSNWEEVGRQASKLKAAYSVIGEEEISNTELMAV